MKRVYPAATALLMLLAASHVAAQSESATQAPQADAPEAEVVTERYKDWALSCRTDPSSGNKACSMFQRLVIEDTNQVALNVAIGFLRDDGGNRVPVAIFTFPLGIFLPGGAEVRVDEGEPVRLQIERCFRRGCQSGMALDDAQLAAFKAGRQANVTIMQDRNQPVGLTISLSGFSAAFAALTELAAPVN